MNYTKLKLWFFFALNSTMSINPRVQFIQNPGGYTLRTERSTSSSGSSKHCIGSAQQTCLRQIVTSAPAGTSRHGVGKSPLFDQLHLGIDINSEEQLQVEFLQFLSPHHRESLQRQFVGESGVAFSFSSPARPFRL